MLLLSSQGISHFVDYVLRNPDRWELIASDAKFDFALTAFAVITIVGVVMWVSHVLRVRK